MKITSHFVGIAFKSDVLVRLIDDLRRYVTKHELSRCIELQDQNSLHLTLYYFNKRLNDRADIVNTCSKLTIERLGVIQAPFGMYYFGNQQSERVCYLRPSNVQALSKLNAYLSRKYHQDTVHENTLLFEPHVTLFRINDPAQFARYKSDVEDIILESLQDFSDDIIGDVLLYAVDSTMSPELQVPIHE